MSSLPEPQSFKLFVCKYSAIRPLAEDFRINVDDGRLAAREDAAGRRVSSAVQADIHLEPVSERTVDLDGEVAVAQRLTPRHDRETRCRCRRLYGVESKARAVTDIKPVVAPVGTDLAAPAPLDCQAGAVARDRVAAIVHRRTERTFTDTEGFNVAHVTERIGFAGLAIEIGEIGTEGRHVKRTHQRQGIALQAVDLKGTAGKQAGTTCVGWPLALTPTARPADVDGALVVWGDRAAFHVRNPATTAVSLEVRVEGGKPRSVTGTTSEADDDHLLFQVPAGGDVSFTTSCSTTSMTLEAMGGGVRQFAFGDGLQPNPVVLEKQAAS